MNISPMSVALIQARPVTRDEEEYDNMHVQSKVELRKLAAKILSLVRDTIAEGYIPFYRAYTCHIVQDDAVSYYVNHDQDYPYIEHRPLRKNVAFLMRELGKEFCAEYNLEWSTSFIEEQWGENFRTEAAIKQIRDLRVFWIDYLVRNYL